MINLGTRREVFFDDYLINEDKSTADILLHKPVPEDIVMSFDKEWEVNSSYVHFFEDDGIYRMYYIAWDKEKFVSQTSDADDKKLRCCYAESKDGLNWTKPERINFGESEDIPLYTNCVSKYERAPHMYIGFPTRYMERKEWTKSFDVLSGR